MVMTEMEEAAINHVVVKIKSAVVCSGIVIMKIFAVELGVASLTLKVQSGIP